MNENTTLLYVEDEASIREEMLEILSLDFDDIHVAENGQQGLELFNQVNPDIIISDIQMPIMDGLHMSKEILSIDPDAKIILTTAFNEEGYRQKAEEIGINHWVYKPVDLEKLFEEIDKILK